MIGRRKKKLTDVLFRPITSDKCSFARHSRLSIFSLSRENQQIDTESRTASHVHLCEPNKNQDRPRIQNKIQRRLKRRLQFKTTLQVWWPKRKAKHEMRRLSPKEVTTKTPCLCRSPLLNEETKRIVLRSKLVIQIGKATLQTPRTSLLPSSNLTTALPTIVYVPFSPTVRAQRELSSAKDVRVKSVLKVLLGLSGKVSTKGL